jgi:7-cyano-7-deazaguanine tRNA-ribosyltransferase
VRKVALHNLHVLRADVLRCKEAICEGRLWDLVEERAMAHPSSAAAFRALGRDHSDWLAKPTRLLKLRGLMVRSDEDTRRPELALARSHLGRFMAKRTRAKASKTAVLVPSSAAPPLTRASGKLRHIKGLEKADLYRINPQLGCYPAELEFVFPFAQTISDREAPEAAVKACVRKLKSMGYSKVVVAGPRRSPA